MASIFYGDAGTNRSISKIYYGDASTTRTIQKIYYGDNGTNRLVYQAYTPMSASANDVNDTVDATITGYSFGPSVCTVTGGNPSKTYAWSYISGTNFTIASPTSASTNFIHGGHPPVGTYSGTYKCTVSDGTSSVDSNTITVTLTRT
jgi:hypothetical protein